MGLETQKNASAQQPGGNREDAILRSAFEAFTRYGFRRTSMEDIAKGAKISRPALYLHFRNKEAIFRAMAEAYFARATRALERALLDKGSAVEVLHRAFVAKDGGILHAIVASPHSAELLDAHASISADIVEDGERRMASLFANWIARGVSEGRLNTTGISGTPAEIAGTLMSALKGLKSVPTTVDTYQAAQRRLAELFGRALARD